MKKLLDSDWLRAVQFKCNTSAKSVTSVKITIDWVMRQATSLRSRGIQWTIFSQPQDLDFADDIAILSSTPTHLQEKTDDLNINAKKTGLIISKKKSKIMCQL